MNKFTFRTDRLIAILLLFLCFTPLTLRSEEENTDSLPDLNAIEQQIRTGQYKSARTHLKKRISSTSGKERARSLHLFHRLAKYTGTYTPAVNRITEFLDRHRKTFEQQENERPAIFTAIKTDLAELRLLQGQYSKAKTHADILLDLDKLNHRARYIRLQVRRKTGAYKKLEEDFTFIRNRSDNGSSSPQQTFHRARIRWMDASWNGNAEIAQEVINICVRLNEQLNENPAFLTFWADSYLEKRHDQDARTTYKDVFAFNNSFPPALTGMARIVLQNKTSLRVGNEEATKLLKKALSINPKYVPAYVTLGKQQMIERKYDRAEKTITRAMKKVDRSPRLLALKATYHYIQDEVEHFEKAKKRALKINPNFGTLYAMLARVLNQNHKYGVAQKMFKKATDLNPHLWTVKRDRGINETRLGNETKGKKILEETFENNPFDVKAYNMLTLLDKLENKFKTYRFPGYLLRVHRSEAPFATPYFKHLLKRIRDEFRDRYKFQLDEPTLVEMFEDHRDFSVRTFGIQGLGAAGACFGTVCTALSPRAQDQLGEYNWGAILWHEMAHAYALQMSNRNVPRWFTEGLSTYEESRGYDSWAREKHVKLFNAWKADKLPTLKKLDSGRGGGVLTYYLYGSVIIEFIIEKHGFDGVLQILRAYGDEKSTEKAFYGVFEKDLAAIQTDLERYLDRRFSDLPLRTSVQAAFKELKKEYLDPKLLKQIKKLRKNLKRGKRKRSKLPDKLRKKLMPDFLIKRIENKIKAKKEVDNQTYVTLARYFAARGQSDRAKSYARKAMSKNKKHPMAYAILGDLNFNKRSWISAANFYKKAFNRGVNDMKTLLRYGKSLEKEEEFDRAIEVYEKARSVFPQYVKGDLNPYLRLHKLYIDQEQPRKALKRLKQYTDRAHKDFQYHMKLASLYFDLEQWKNLKDVLERLIYVNYRDLKMHTYLAKTYENLSEWKNAHRERSVIIALLRTLKNRNGSRNDNLMVTNYLKLAKLSKKMGKRDRAEKEAQKVLDRDPTNKKAINFLRSLD